MSRQNDVYGKPCSVNYFLTAIKTMCTLENNLKFYFFSDEVSWVVENLLPVLPPHLNYTICDQNGSDKGYLDLYLISHCKHIIASKGSLGSYARILSKSDGYFIGTENVVFLASYFDKCIFISSETEKLIPHKKESYKQKICRKILKFLINFIPSSTQRKHLREKYKLKKVS